MPPESASDRGERDRYAIVTFPAGRSGKPRTVSFSRGGFVLGIASSVLVVIILTVAIIVYTPVGSRLPIADQELEKRYGEQIAGIQKQLRTLAEEMNRLNLHNLRLRKALGESVPTSDSAIAESPVDTSPTGSLSGIMAGGNEADSGLQTQESGGKTVGGERRLPGFATNGLRGRAEGPVPVPLTMPADGYLSKGFESGGFHYGIDIAGKEGSGILAAADGQVVFSGWTYDDGFMLMIAHAEGLVTVYKHNQSLLKSSGAAVKRGELIALMGNTGQTSTGPHLHFEVWKNGVAGDPQQYLLTTP
jgi:murein DD-endopeptidase MepM/ murein hydrolase activator NlpD